MDYEYSVLIPAYNREAFLPACLDSLLAQSFTNWEAVVADDGSADQTCAVVEEYCRRYPQVRLVRQANQGAAVARNTAFHHSRGRKVIFLDSDDFLLPAALANFEIGFESGCEVVCGFWDERGAGVRQTDARPAVRVMDAFMGNLFVGERPPLHMSTVAMSRECIDKIGPMKRMLCEDWEFWIRLTARYRIGFVQAQVSCYRRSHGDGINDRLKADGRIMGALSEILHSIHSDPIVLARLHDDPGLSEQFHRLYQARLTLYAAAHDAFLENYAEAAAKTAECLRLSHRPEEKRAQVRALQELLFYPTHLPLQGARRALRASGEILRHWPGQPEDRKILEVGSQDFLFWQARDLLYQGDARPGLQLATYVWWWTRCWRSCKSYLRYLRDWLGHWSFKRRGGS